MRIFIRIVSVTLLTTLLISCSTYKPIKINGDANQTDLEYVNSQLQQVNLNEMIMVVMKDKKKHDFEYLSHTKDTLSGILHHSQANKPNLVNEVEMTIPISSISEIKSEQINYLLSIGMPVGLTVAAVIIFMRSWDLNFNPFATVDTTLPNHY